MLNNENIPFISVTALNAIVKLKLEGDSDLRGLYVKGEISNWKIYRSGVFFDLKDENGSVISCLIWTNNVSKLSFVPKNGDEVIVYGNINVYAARGQYKLQVFTLFLYGYGASLIALENLKKKLAAEGIFDEERKRPIPKIPNVIGIIVGKNSAAESDLRKNITRRWPLTEVRFFYAQVQGTDAPKSLIKALDAAKSYDDIDTLIVARGGGSNEDLSAFNDENVVRAFAQCPFPFISAVGHEIDVTLIDYVADKRVSTPTAAAEAATPNQDDIREYLLGHEKTLKDDIDKKINDYRTKIEFLSKRPFFLKPSSIYSDMKKEVLDKSSMLAKAVRNMLVLEKNSVDALEKRLNSSNPDNIVKKGFSITTDEKGKPLTSIKKIKEGQTIKTRLKDGIIASEVLRKEQ